jgi:two-component system, chemotaxis family, response regulator Rcp1
MSALKPCRVLIVEDNPGDVDLLLETFNESSRRIECSIASDGVQALRMLREGFKPQLILLDLNLPKKDGRPVLAELKNDPDLLHIPIVVFTSSEAERDLLDVYRLHANCLLSKPVDLQEFQRVVKGIEEFWLRTVKLPPP